MSPVVWRITSTSTNGWYTHLSEQYEGLAEAKGRPKQYDNCILDDWKNGYNSQDALTLVHIFLPPGLAGDYFSFCLSLFTSSDMDSAGQVPAFRCIGSLLETLACSSRNLSPSNTGGELITYLYSREKVSVL